MRRELPPCRAVPCRAASAEQIVLAGRPDSCYAKCAVTLRQRLIDVGLIVPAGQQEPHKPWERSRKYLRIGELRWEPWDPAPIVDPEGYRENRVARLLKRS